MGTKILKKVSVATVCNKPKTFFKTLEKETPIMRIFGMARKYDIGTSTYGDYLKFYGEFQAIDLDSGEISMGAVAFLPSPIDALLKAQIDALSEEGKRPVEFAFDISVIPDSKTEVGFQYRVSTLEETKVSDPLAALAARFKVEPLKLANEVSAQNEEVKPDPAQTKEEEKKPFPEAVKLHEPKEKVTLGAKKK